MLFLHGKGYVEDQQRALHSELPEINELGNITHEYFALDSHACVFFICLEKSS